MKLIRQIERTAQLKAIQAASAVGPDARKEIELLAQQAIAEVQSGGNADKATPWWILRNRPYALGESQVALSILQTLQSK